MIKPKFPIEQKAWAIRVKGKEYDGLIGHYWFSRNPLPEHMRGQTVCLFKTRMKARIYHKTVKRVYPNSKVERVFVKIAVL